MDDKGETADNSVAEPEENVTLVADEEGTGGFAIEVQLLTPGEAPVTPAGNNDSPDSPKPQQQKGRSGWDAANTTLGAFALANGTKLTMLESGAALSRELRISKVNGISMVRTYGATGAKYLKFAKGLGVAGSVVTTGYSVSKVMDQHSTGGWSEVGKHRDVWDAGVGIIVLGATGLAAFGIISNPIGWGIGIGVLVYGGATLIYDAVKD